MTRPDPSTRRTVRARILRALPAIGWAGVIFTMSSIPGTNLPGGFAFQGHFIGYAILGVLVFIALNRDTPDWRRAGTALVICSLYGVTDEIHQAFVPSRTPDPLDWVVDTVGAAAGIAAALALARWRASRRSS